MNNEMNPETLPPTNANAVAKPSYNIPKLTSRLRLAKKPKRIVRHRAAEVQVKILLHVYNHEGVSLKKIRPLFKLTDVTLFRHMGTLKHLGFVKWKGAHRNGGYVMTAEGKEFVEKNG
jgi:predicted transcriptional regulator